MKKLLGAAAAGAVLVAGYALYPSADQDSADTIATKDVSVATASVGAAPSGNGTETATDKVRPVEVAASVATDRPSATGGSQDTAAMVTTVADTRATSEQGTPDMGNREPMICAIWAMRKLAEDIGLAEAGEHSIAQRGYPVPVPIWMMNSLLTAVRS